ncbi:MAG: hypothetical protein ACYC3W_07045 [Candidatus Nanopelagicales bacterium]
MVAFQERVKLWLIACFGDKAVTDTVARNQRFLEEALELVQACGTTEEEAHQLVAYVYGRPVGYIHQEIGGVMITLAALCQAQQQDMVENGDLELANAWTRIEAIRAKPKPKIGLYHYLDYGTSV